MIDRREFLAVLSSLFVQVPIGNEKPKVEPPGNGDGAIVSALKSIEGGKRLPGLTAAIVVPNQPTRVGAIGVRKIGSPQAFEAGDLVHIGSCTKAMTATMIATLVEEQKLSWTSTLEAIFPDVPMHQEFRGVTLSQLLTHRSGLPANTTWLGLGREKSTTDQRREALEQAVKSAPKDKPGTKMLYSNLGYAYAGLMAETVTKTPWEELMRQRVFKPLAMGSAGFGPPGAKGKVEQPWGHVQRFGTVVASQTDNPPALGPAGTVHCTMVDWAKFADLHLRGARGEKTAILKAKTFRTLQIPAPGDHYAMGWGVVERDWAKGTTLSHSGSNTQWFCTVWIAPKRNVALLAATNQGADAADKSTDSAVAAMLKLLAPEAKS